MSTATEEHLREAHHRIASLEARAQEGAADARPRMQRYIDAVRRDEQAARDSARTEAHAVGERLEQLDTSLELAEPRVAAELAPTREQLKGALEAQLHRWDTYLDRVQTEAAGRAGVAREHAEATVTDLRQRRLSIGAHVSALGTAAGDGWRDVKSRALNELDELKTKADTARRK